METAMTPPKKIGKFRASYRLTKTCFALLMKDKEIMWFPILSSIAVLGIVGVVGGGLFTFLMQADQATTDAITQRPEMKGLSYIIMFVIYLVSAFIATYFQAGLTAIVYGRIQGKDLSFKDGIAVANAHVKKIFLWALLSATIGIVLKAIGDKFKVGGSIAAGLAGVAWAVLTVFIVPTLILEKGTVMDAVRRSGETFKKTWGETLITNFSVSTFTTVLFLFLLIPLIAVMFTGNMAIIIGSGIAIFVLIIIVAIVSTSLEGIFRVVLYHYAITGSTAAGFDNALVAGAMKKKA